MPPSRSERVVQPWLEILNEKFNHLAPKRLLTIQSSSIWLLKDFWQFSHPLSDIVLGFSTPLTCFVLEHLIQKMKLNSVSYFTQINVCVTDKFWELPLHFDLTNPTLEMCLICIGVNSCQCREFVEHEWDRASDSGRVSSPSTSSFQHDGASGKPGAW